MSLFAIADLHLSFGSDKPMDIFKGWDDYTERIEKNWRCVVTEDDTVVIAGDISWALKLKDTRKDFTFLESLPGKKILLKGNHDYWWQTKSKLERFFAENAFDSLSVLFNCAYTVDHFCVCGTRGWFYDAEHDEDKKILNREVGRLRTSIECAEKTGLEPIVFLHYPPVFGTVVCKEILGVLQEKNIKKCYYGHIHGSDAMKKAVVGDYLGIQFRLISCDCIGFMPVLVR